MKCSSKLFLLLLLLLSLTVLAQSVMKPFPQHVEYAEGTILPSKWAQSELDASVQAFYDRWKATYLRTVPGVEPKQVYLDWNVKESPWVEPVNSVTVSEAHGYGMMILAYMAGYDEESKELFDAMYRFYRAHPSRFNDRLMAWQQLEVEDEEGKIVIIDTEDNDSAVDGDLDIGFALLLADNQWGNDGEINYRSEGLACIKQIMDAVVNPDEAIILLGDWVKEKKEEMPQYCTVTRPSDFILDHLNAFAVVDPENSEAWQVVYDKIISISQYIYENYTPKTGLLPDFLERDETGAYVPAEGTVLETEHDGDYNWNACRVPWRIGTEYLISGNPELRQQLKTMNSWIQEATGSDPLNINPGYYILNEKEGTPIVRDWEGTDMSFVAPFAVSACASAESQEWLDRLWTAMISDSWDTGLPFEEVTYFPNTIRMINLIIVSGNYWLPE